MCLVEAVALELLQLKAAKWIRPDWEGPEMADYVI